MCAESHSPAVQRTYCCSKVLPQGKQGWVRLGNETWGKTKHLAFLFQCSTRRRAAASSGLARTHHSWASRLSGWSSTARCLAGCGCHHSSQSWLLHLFGHICLTGQFCGGRKKERMEPPWDWVTQPHCHMWRPSLPVYVEFSVVG